MIPKKRRQILKKFNEPALKPLESIGADPDKVKIRTGPVNVPRASNEIEVIDEENVVTQELSVEPSKTEKLRTEKPKNSIKEKGDEDDDEGQTKLF